LKSKRFSTLLAALGGHALAEHELHLAARREPARAGQRGIAQRRSGGGLVQVQRLQQLGALRAFDEAHGNALAHAVGRAPHVLAHAGGGGRAVQLQDEELLLVDGLPGARADVLHERPAGIELIAARA
jgi:hypothetical protein